MDISEKLRLDIIRENPKALLWFYQHTLPFLRKFFFHKVSDEKDREELLQDTLLSIFDSLPQFCHQSSFSTWCIGIAKHELVDYYRRQKIKTILFSHFPFLKDIVDKALGPQLALEEKETKDKIFSTFKNLSEGNSLVLRLRYIEGLSVSDIALKLGITYKAAESRLSRARLAFQELYVYKSTTIQEDP